MLVDVRDVISSLQATARHERRYAVSSYDEGYVDGLERAADIAVVKALGLKAGVESDTPRQPRHDADHNP